MTLRTTVVGQGSVIGRAYAVHCQGKGHEVELLRASVPDVLLGSTDVLVTCHGMTVNGLLRGITSEAWDRVVQINLCSVARCIKNVLPAMEKGGNIVVLGSIVGSLGGRGCSSYAAAKAGLVGLVRAVANENPHLRINLLELGYVDAGMGARLDPKVKEVVLKTIPMKRFARLEEVVQAIDFLATQTYMTGGILTFAGGLR